MNKTVKWIIIAAVLAAVVAGAYVLYNSLGKDYGASNLNDLSLDKDGNDKAVQDGANKETDKTEQTEENASGGQDSASDQYNKAPDFTVLDIDGEQVKLSDYLGKPVVLNFWATWCYYCKVEMPDFDTASEKYPDVQFMMVNATDGVKETMSGAKKYIEDEGFRFDVFFDTQLEAVNKYGVTGFPTTYFIDEKGNLVAKGSGMLDLATLETGIAMITQ